MKTLKKTRTLRNHPATPFTAHFDQKAP